MATNSQRTGRIPLDTLARRVRIAREEAGLSQREAALKCGITFGKWQGLEGGAESRGLDVMIGKIAAGLDYDRDWLMWGGPLASADGVTAMNRGYPGANPFAPKHYAA